MEFNRSTSLQPLPERKRWPIIFVAILCVALVGFAFGTSLLHGFSTMDDSYLVVNNLTAHGFSWAHIKSAFSTFDPELYIPVTFLSYQLDYSIAGLAPWMYHFTNLILHIFNALLVVWFIMLLTKKKVPAYLAGLLFAVHPLHTEAVVWIAGRKDLLSTLFFLLSLISYLKWKEGRSTRLYLVSLAAFLLALLSKVSVLTLPVILVLIDIVWERRRPHLRMLANKVPFLALSTALGIIAWVGKERILASSSLVETLLMAAKSTVFYLEKLVLPINLTALYPYQNAITIGSPDFLIPVCIVSVLVILTLVSLRWSRWGMICATFFIVTLSPTYLNFHKGEVTFFAVDRYAYVPSIGCFLLIGIICSRLLDALQGHQHEKKMRAVVAFLIAIIFSNLIVLSSNQTKVWASDESLFNRALTLYPDSVPARISLSVIYRETGRTDAERGILLEGLKRQKNVAYYTGLGSIAAGEAAAMQSFPERMKKIAEAEQYYLSGQAFDPRNPEPLFYLGALAELRSNPDAAVRYYSGAVALDPSYVAALNNLASIQMERKNLGEAEQLLRQALTYNPNFMEGHYNLFQILEMAHKDREEALSHLRKAYELNPSNTDILGALAYRLIERKQFREAETILKTSIEENPENRGAVRMLDYLRLQEK